MVQQLQQYSFDHDGMVIWGYREDLNASVPGLDRRFVHTVVAAVPSSIARDLIAHPKAAM